MLLSRLQTLLMQPAIVPHASGQGFNMTNCSYPVHWFTQAIDHTVENGNTFEQRFYMTTKFYKPGGPILLFQGEETVDLDCVDSTIMFDFARELNGIAVNLEHRYFGASVPFGMNLTGYTQDEWKYLTLDNVMDDAVSFVEFVKNNFTASSDAPVFVASGSYGGFLMTMFRQNRPHAFDGVIASAPPLRAFYGENDGNVPDQFNWWNSISRLLAEESMEAAAQIKNAFASLTRKFADNRIATLQEELGLCRPVTGNDTASLSALTSFIAQTFSVAIEFNYNSAHPGRVPFANPLRKILEIALTESDPIQILNRTTWLWYQASAASIGANFPCVDQDNVEQEMLLMAPLISTVPFFYIICTYASFDVSSVPDDNSYSIFPATILPSLLHQDVVQHCQSEYGVSPLSAEYMYSHYRFTDIDLQNSTGIIFSLAQYDPTTSISGMSSFAMPEHGNGYSSRRLFTTGMAHREDLFAQTDNTKATVKKTNEIELQILKEWMEIIWCSRQNC